MALVQRGSGPGLASSGGDPPKKPPGRSQLPLPADCPKIPPKPNKKGQAPQFIRSYGDLPEWKDRRQKARFTKTPPKHLNEEHTEYYHTQHNLLMTANDRYLRGEIENRPSVDIQSRARRELWVLWFVALIEARRLGEAGGAESSDDAEGDTDAETIDGEEDDEEEAEGEAEGEADAEGETDPEAMDETEDEDAEGETEPEIKEEDVE